MPKFYVLCLQEQNLELMLVMPWRYNTKYTILKIASVLKIVIFPSSDKTSHTPRFYNIINAFYRVTKIFILLKLSLYEICTPNTLMHSLVRYRHFIPQSATVTLFRTPIPAISHLVKLG